MVGVDKTVMICKQKIKERNSDTRFSSETFSGQQLTDISDNIESNERNSWLLIKFAIYVNV